MAWRIPVLVSVTTPGHGRNDSNWMMKEEMFQGWGNICTGNRSSVAHITIQVDHISLLLVLYLSGDY